MTGKIKNTGEENYFWFHF